MIVWHLPRYHDIKVSRNGCCQVLKRNKLNRLSDNIEKRSRYKFMRFDKKVPGHHAQVDVKFLFFKDEDGQRIYIKPATPRLNGKVERSHLTDKRAFYQVLDDDGDVNLRQKLGQWEDYYNFLRPHQHMQEKRLMKC